MKRKQLEKEQTAMRSRVGARTTEAQTTSKLLRYKTASTVERRVHDFFINARCEVFRNGWPDFLIKKGNKHILVETKGKHERVSAVQTAMHKVLKGMGLNVIVFRPEVDSLYQLLAKF